MEINQEIFEDFPIDFRRINPEDFPNFIIENSGNKKILVPDVNNYINTSLQESINIERKNTVVVNSSAGQGKTFAIIEIVKKYYELSNEYVIFVASPFVSLVDQYEAKIIEKGIPESSIYRYEKIGDERFLNYTEKRVHIVTANLLLGNPGEDAFINSEAKREYLNRMSFYCERQNKKAIFIYDELHDSTYNFKEEYIFNLWKWRNSIHKTFVLSASFSEASKIVLKYLAELTEKRILILESERKQYKEPSKLYLHFDIARHYNGDNGTIEGIIRDFNNRDLEYDVLTFSKSLAESLYSGESSSGRLILDKYGEQRQLCVSDLRENQRIYRETPRNRYHAGKCNIGTNFKSGVSIEKDNHAYLIILPPIGAKDFFKNHYGIFSDGQNSIIQALARQRISGEIHIVLPPPIRMDYESLLFDNEDQLEYYKSIYEELLFSISNVEELPKYYGFNEHLEILSDFYENTLKQNLISEISYLQENRSEPLSLNFPSLDSFIISKGDSYLANKYSFMGDNPSMFVVNSAITNQFVNCRLYSINTKPTLYFNEGRIQEQLENVIRENLTPKLFNAILIHSNDSMSYNSLRESLFEDFKLFYVPRNGSPIVLKPYKERKFETQLIAYIQRMQHKANDEFNSRYINENETYRDHEFTRADYFLANISQARNQSLSAIEEDSIAGRIKAYKLMDFFREKVIFSQESHTIQSSSQTIQFLRKSLPENLFSLQEIADFEEMRELLFLYDDMLSNEVFSYKKSMFRGDTQSQLNYFYRRLIEDFVVTSNKRIFLDSNEQMVNQIVSVKQIPEHSITIDLLSEPDYNNAEKYEGLISETEMFNVLKSMEEN